MKHQKKKGIMHLVILLAMVFIIVIGVLIELGAQFINQNLMNTNKATAIDLALLVKNNFIITNEEVEYMKSLSFNEMESDAINHRLMDVGNGVELNAKVENVYLIIQLSEKEKITCMTEKDAEMIGYPVGTELDGMWLLNGRIDEDGHFVEAQRENICRYTKLTDEMIKAMALREDYGTVTSDIWGYFITGYVPVFSVEGDFVGMLGIDITPDAYQSQAKGMISILIFSFIGLTLVITILFIVFYIKYTKVKKENLYFEFYSQMSHDVRTAMNCVIGMARVSEQEQNTEVLHQNIRRIETSGNYIMRLLNDSLDMNRISSGTLAVKPGIYSVSEMLESLHQMITPIAEQNGITITQVEENFDINRFACIDAIRVNQILMCLLDNAVKFSEQNGKVLFKIMGKEKEGDFEQVTFIIEDHGIGMSERFMKQKLFQPFKKENRAKIPQYEGSGLGLSIAKNLVELMGGQISVESRIHEGSVFTVILDMQLYKQEEINKSMVTKQKETVIESALRGKKILLCEDHPINTEIICNLLQKQGCIVTCVSNGEEGVKKFIDSPLYSYDAILMDIRMPVMNGIEATTKIREQNRADASGIPIIAITANSYEKDIQVELKAGFNGHVSKPVIPQQLYDILAENL